MSAGQSAEIDPPACEVCGKPWTSPEPCVLVSGEPASPGLSHIKTKVCGCPTCANNVEDDVPLCKHCGLSLRPDGGYFLHAEGMQEGFYRCAVKPYGFNAEPVGTDCGRTCNGAYEMAVRHVYSPGQAAD